MELSTVLAEQTEIGAYADFAGGAPAAVLEKLGIGVENVGSAQVLAVPHTSARFWNKAGGFGGDTPVTADTMAVVCDFFRDRAVAAGSIMIAPSQLPEDWAEISAKLNLTEGSRYAKLGCAVDDVLSRPAGVLGAGLWAGPVEQRQATEWATVMMATFGFDDDGMAEMAASSIGRPKWRSYAAWEGERIVATGSIYVNGDYADVFGAATLPEARGRGAQSALLTARAHAAKEAGCTWLVAETGAEKPGSYNTSLHNMLRAGFRPLYERTSWVWHGEE